jgi:group I intron endonuclease
MQGIYRITNTKNGRTYIGSSKNVPERLRVHRRSLENGKHYNWHLQAEWDKFGELSFTFELICEFVGSPLELVQEEERLLNECGDNVYNIIRTKLPSPTSCPIITEKMRQTKLTKYSPEERSRRAKLASDAAKKKISKDDRVKMAATGARVRWKDETQRKRQSEVMKRVWAEKREIMLENCRKTSAVKKRDGGGRFSRQLDNPQ